MCVGQKESRVSANGSVLLFASVLPQTAHDSGGKQPLYRYDASSGQVLCVSCKPNGAPGGSASLKQAGQGHTGSSEFSYNAQAFLSRNLSSDGSRVFFQTSEKLVAADVNGDHGCPDDLNRGAARTCTDVYEWEAPGKGSCSEASGAYSALDGGCIYLLSTGTSSYPAYLADASLSGDTVFIYSREQLVPQDEDNLNDIYAVSVDGGLPSQHESRQPACTGEACRGAGTHAQGAQGAGSAAFSGPGNQASEGSALRNCTPAAKRAQRLARLAKHLRRRSRRVHGHRASAHLRHRAALLAHRAHRLSRSARLCRRANRRAAR